MESRAALSATTGATRATRRRSSSSSATRRCGSRTRAATCSARARSCSPRRPRSRCSRASSTSGCTTRRRSRRGPRRWARRFTLGLGASHEALIGERYARPLSAMRAYLDELDGLGAGERLLAALGPRMLELARTRAAGAHPYLVPVEHTRQRARGARAGPRGWRVEQGVVLARDRDAARAHVAAYLELPNYVANFRRLGYGDADFADGGSDALVDALVAWGDEEAIAGRVRAQLQAGADHVCIQVIDAVDDLPPREAWRRLAPRTARIGFQIMIKLTVLYGHPDDPGGVRAALRRGPRATRREDAEPAPLREGARRRHPDGSPPPYYRVVELYFDSEEELQASRATPEGRAPGEDVPNYATGGATVLIACRLTRIDQKTYMIVVTWRSVNGTQWIQRTVERELVPRTAPPHRRALHRQPRRHDVHHAGPDHQPAAGRGRGWQERRRRRRGQRRPPGVRRGCLAAPERRRAGEDAAPHRRHAARPRRGADRARGARHRHADLADARPGRRARPRTSTTTPASSPSCTAARSRSATSSSTTPCTSRSASPG